MNIVEAFQKKLAISEKVYEKEHGGNPLSESKKIAIYYRISFSLTCFYNRQFIMFSWCVFYKTQRFHCLWHSSFTWIVLFPSYKR